MRIQIINRTYTQICKILSTSALVTRSWGWFCATVSNCDVYGTELLTCKKSTRSRKHDRKENDTGSAFLPAAWIGKKDTP
eukprot:m.100257 g.100257  ORF g.100257 m.100257 type:complete len:80 (-) comp13696_c0_seq2:2466-2705(-)